MLGEIADTLSVHPLFDAFRTSFVDEAERVRIDADLDMGVLVIEHNVMCDLAEHWQNRTTSAEAESARLRVLLMQSGKCEWSEIYRSTRQERIDERAVSVGMPPLRGVASDLDAEH